VLVPEVLAMLLPVVSAAAPPVVVPVPVLAPAVVPLELLPRPVVLAAQPSWAKQANIRGKREPLRKRMEAYGQ
jgi:hypothetical protein